MSKDNSSFHYATDAANYKIADYTLGTMGLVSCLVGMPGSLITFGYFFTRGRNISTIQHMMISAVDSIITFLLLFNGMSEFNDGNPMMFGYRWFCVGWAFTWQACIRLSIFLVAVLSVCRTVSLVYPFLKIKMSSIFIPILLYLTLVVGQQALPIFAGKSFWYARRLSMCTWLITDVFELHSMEFKVVHFGFITLEFVIPAIPIVVCCIVIICLLNRQKKFSTPKGALEKIEATKTTIYLTSAYIIFNAPLIIVCLLESITILSDFKFQMQQFGLPVYVLDFIYTMIGLHSVALNSTTNVIIFFCRREGLRAFCWALVTCNWKSMKTGSGYSKPRVMGIYNPHACRRSNRMELAIVQRGSAVVNVLETEPDIVV